MAEALMHPVHGYYAKADPFGADGDFTTAPEISQMFGELIGLWCVEMWHQLGAPAEIQLVELGPGRGTLMVDALRAASIVPAFIDAVSLHLVEASPALRSVQENSLRAFSVTWHDTMATVPDGPMLLVANEFFDALPIHQFTYTEKGWCERLVTSIDGDFSLIVAPRSAPLASLIPKPLSAIATIGAITEICPAALSLIERISAKLVEFGGAALVIDYGDEQVQARPTLQSLRAHEYHDFLQTPGAADITAHVDFAGLKRAVVPKAECWGPIAQRDFLLRLGLMERAERLRVKATEMQRADIDGACHRLIAPEEMGTLFKALAITADRANPPPAF
jgi:NADH dehydrogenase [ubiquinone] 1 alpha subcomplex assembly factor 7